MKILKKMGIALLVIFIALTIFIMIPPAESELKIHGNYKIM
jgi:hypothetical protein